jgi:hypothetical protein
MRQGAYQEKSEVAFTDRESHKTKPNSLGKTSPQQPQLFHCHSRHFHSPTSSFYFAGTTGTRGFFLFMVCFGYSLAYLWFALFMVWCIDDLVYGLVLWSVYG